MPVFPHLPGRHPHAFGPLAAQFFLLDRPEPRAHLLLPPLIQVAADCGGEPLPVRLHNGLVVIGVGHDYESHEVTHVVLPVHRREDIVRAVPVILWGKEQRDERDAKGEGELGEGLGIEAACIWPQDVTRYFKLICKRAGIGNWIPRELRHTFVSVLSDSGVDIEHIADAVGHVNSTITKTVYRHQIADKVTVAATAIFGEASGT